MYTNSTQLNPSPGQYQCAGFNKLPLQTNEQSDSATVSLVLVKNVDVTLTKSITSTLNEVDFGSTFTITCVADGGRIPFYLEFNHTPRSSSTATQIVLYNNETHVKPDKVKVNEDLNTLTYVHSVSTSRYSHDGTFKCTSKNRAVLLAEGSDVESQSIVVGECLIPYVR